MSAVSSSASRPRLPATIDQASESAAAVSSSASRPRLPATIDVADLDVRGKQLRVEALVGADDRPHGTAGDHRPGRRVRRPW